MDVAAGGGEALWRDASPPTRKVLGSSRLCNGAKRWFNPFIRGSST